MLQNKNRNGYINLFQGSRGPSKYNYLTRNTGMYNRGSTSTRENNKRQALQVFIEGLGDLKNYIKARHPDSLFNAIQVDREEEKVRKSSEEFRKLYKLTATSKPQPGVCNVCKKPGHWARYCRYAKSNNKKTKQNTTPASVATVGTVTCQYCKRPGHTKEVCQKLKYVQSKKMRPTINKRKTPNNRALPADARLGISNA